MRDHWTSSRLLRRTVGPLAICLTGALAVVAAPATQTAAAPGTSPASAGLGTTWVDRSSQFSGNHWNAVAYGDGLFVAASPSGSTGAGHRIMRSTDGVTWTRNAGASAEGVSVAFGDDTFVSVMQNGTVYASPDGIAWTNWNQGVGPSNGWQSVTYGDGKFLAVAYSGGYPSARSTNGVAWTFAGLPYLTPVTGAWESVAFGDDTFVAVENNTSSARVAYATDDTWTIISAPKSANWNSVTYGAGLFVAVSDDSVMTSPNGHTWTLRTAAENNYWTSVTYAAGMFVAVSSNGTNRVMTSIDGIAWTARSVPQRGWRSVTFGNGGFVAVGDAGAVMTSGIVAGLTPTLDTAVRTADGYTVNVTNYDPSYTWTPTVSAGSVTAGTASGGILPLTVTGLGAAGSATLTVTTSRTSYTDGTATATRPAVAPPSAPAITGVTPGDGQASVAFAPPLSDGGSAVTRIEFALDDTSTVDDSTTGPSPYSLSGLANGASRVVFARAVNSAGAGAWSAPSSPFTPQAPSPPVVVSPGPPNGVQALRGDGSATVSWVAPTEAGSFPVTTYQVESVPNDGTCLTSSLTCEVTGLLNGASYTFRVRALSGAGWGPWSDMSNAITPSAPAQLSIVIAGSRGAVRGKPGIVMMGTTTGFGMGAAVTPWSGRKGGEPAPGTPALVSVDGTFTWSRRASALETWILYATVDTVRSNTVTIRPNQGATRQALTGSTNACADLSRSSTSCPRSPLCRSPRLPSQVVTPCH